MDVKMALNFSSHSGCYCCERTNTARMDIDSALDELGMLSSITESRKQYLRRPHHAKTHSLPVSTSTSSYHIVQIDTKYVTGFSSSQEASEPQPEPQPESSTSQSNCEVFLDQSKDYRNPPENLDSTVDSHRRSKMLRLKYRQENISARNHRILARKRAKQPYEVPWRLTQSFQESMLLKDNDIPESKSNSSSPVKPINPDSLSRSRSLDNLDFSSFVISESREKQDIDGVASGIKNLNVTDS
ncbi:hypothetical protein MAR_032325 [Mya arenaria]|uniref:Uncharacterized protein n=1 Tax=Mya arenaria TaxID=6604 RepID=A0ABY7F9R1_MYAAR|nr:hypothetical protein MAR_032300 [Mya arenaria]WAR17731.1 hypothetical protein MAR_032325 [Mya arenaria]